MNEGTHLTVNTGAGSYVLGDAYGIYARNNGNGALTILANGIVTGNMDDGIRALNNNGTSLSITTGAVTGGAYGINAQNFGSGALTVTANGNVTGNGADGIFAENNGAGALTVIANGNVSGDNNAIYARNTAGPSLDVTTAANRLVEGGNYGVFALNYSGALNVTANGNVTGIARNGISALNQLGATSLSIRTGAGSYVLGNNRGIYASNSGNGALNITANGNVRGNNETGIYASNSPLGAGLNITTGANSRVMGANCGIVADNSGGALNIKAGGDVIGTNCAGIQALNSGTTTRIATGEGSTVRGRYYGIDLLHLGTGAVNIEVNGDVVATDGTAIVAAHLFSDGVVNITVGPNARVRSNGNDPLVDFGIVIAGGTGNVTVGGKIDGGAGGAILFDQGDPLDNRLELHPTAAVNGNVFAGPGANDTLAFGGAGNGAFNLTSIDTGAGTRQYQSFENFEVESGDWNFSGATTQAFTVNGGTVMGNGTVNLTGATLRVLAANGNYQPTTDYVIIDNDGTDAVQGRFARVTANLAFLTPSVDYKGGDGNDVVLTLLRTVGPGPGPGPISFCSVALTSNQCNVGLALDQFPTTNALFLAVLNQTAEGARMAFDALSGEIHATLSGVLADDSRYVREAILGRLMQANASGGNTQVASLAAAGPQVASLDSNAMTLGTDKSFGSASAPYRQPLAFWTRAYGAWGDFDGDGNAASTDRDLGGFVSGMDAQLSGSWRAGLATGASFANVDVDDRYSSADVESFLLAGYLGGMAGPVALRGGGAWAWNDIDTSRAVIFPGFFERQNASYDADTGQIFGEVAYPMAMGGMAIEPFAGLAYVS
ncbi:MAG: autotransporter outer membrane beta-barrel domain-containing protein, partial [Methyloceanibacter sp.]|uniref:autotransporter outer membrane beta-barrel domain-containing protein n=1 Tax=Methyloceanibacter sp. TaxID=1965321 RepID=UPI003D6C8C31